MNRPIETAIESDNARAYYLRYHSCVEQSLQQASVMGCARVLLLDIHGQVRVSYSHLFASCVYSLLCCSRTCPDTCCAALATCAQWHRW